MCFPRLHFLLHSIHIVETTINSTMSFLMSMFPAYQAAVLLETSLYVYSVH